MEYKELKTDLIRMYRLIFDQAFGVQIVGKCIISILSSYPTFILALLRNDIAILYSDLVYERKALALWLLMHLNFMTRVT